MLKFTKDHEWIRLESHGTATVGISDYAQEQLGDLVYVDVPPVGKDLDQGGEVAVVESVKAASEIYSPAAGKVIAHNEKLNAEPGLVNSAPMTDGWMFKLKLNDPKQLDALMDEAAYKTFVATH